MRPVIIPDAHPSYPRADLLDDLTNAVGANGSQMTVLQVILQLQALVNIWVNGGMEVKKKRTALGESKKIWPNAASEKAYEALKGHVGTGYGFARRDLINAVGQYCSYCEIPLFSHLSVEHTLPKSMFPSRALSWSNFLLACPSCNSTKGSRPDQHVVTPPNTDLAVLKIESTASYLWPQKFWDGLPNGSPLPYTYVLKRLVPRGKGTYDMVFAEDFTMAEINSLVDSYQSGELTVWWGKVARKVGRSHELMAVQVLPNILADDSQKRAARAMIDLAGLNRILQADKGSASVDRRVELRTLAYFKALLMLRLWTQAWESGDRALHVDVTKQLARVVRATGFWGVWLMIFGSLTNGQQLLRRAIPGTALTQWI